MKRINNAIFYVQIQQEILREANIRGMLEKDMDVLRHEKSKLTDEIHVRKKLQLYFNCNCNLSRL